MREDRPTVARYALSGQSLPRLLEALSFAEKVHDALVELSGGSSVFTGCDDGRKPLQGHKHAFILSESNQALGKGDNGEITHLTISAPMGFGEREIKILGHFAEVHRDDEDAVRLILLGMGQPENFGGADLSRGQSLLLAESKTWISRTPFIPTRHPKVTRAGAAKKDSSGLQIGSPEHELRRLLGLAGFPEPVAVEPLGGTTLGERLVTWNEFQCRRSNGDGRRAAYDRGYGFWIEFSEAVRGPVAVGYRAHFGMGGFEARGNECVDL